MPNISPESGAIRLQGEIRWLFDATRDSPDVVHRANNVIEFTRQSPSPEIIRSYMPAPYPGLYAQFSVIAAVSPVRGEFLPVASLAFHRMELTRRRQRESAVVYYASSIPFRLGRLSLCFGTFEYFARDRGEDPERRKQSNYQEHLYQCLAENKPLDSEIATILQFEGQMDESAMSDEFELTTLRQIIGKLGEGTA